MRQRLMLTTLAAGLIGLGTAYAHGDRDPGEMFDALDSNGDGQLSASELERMHEARGRHRFEKADANDDGRIDKDEFMAKAQERAERMFEHMDEDGDGAVTADEAKPPKHGGKHAKGKRRDFDPMARMDANDDGAISRDEWQTAVEKFHDRHDDE